MADKKPSPLYVNQPDYGSSKGYNSSLGNTGTQPLMKKGEEENTGEYPGESPPSRKQSPLYDKSGKKAKTPLPPPRPKDLPTAVVADAAKPAPAPDNQAPVAANKDVLGRGGRRPY